MKRVLKDASTFSLRYVILILLIKFIVNQTYQICSNRNAFWVKFTLKTLDETKVDKANMHEIFGHKITKIGQK